MMNANDRAQTEKDIAELERRKAKYPEYSVMLDRWIAQYRAEMK